MHNFLGRRDFARGLLGIGAAGTTLATPGWDTRAQERSAAAGGLPARPDFVIRNAYLLTMDPGLGDVPDGDIHVKDGQIVEVGKNLQVPGAAAIDGRRAIVLPGLIDTHWHMWT